MLIEPRVRSWAEGHIKTFGWRSDPEHLGRDLNRDKKTVSLRDSEGNFRYGDKGIGKYAHLGAAYYATRVAECTDDNLVLALAVNGYIPVSESEIRYEVALYATTKDNPELNVHVGDYEDLSFLEKHMFSPCSKKLMMLLILWLQGSEKSKRWSLLKLG